jgi:hypothetical protein
VSIMFVLIASFLINDDANLEEAVVFNKTFESVFINLHGIFSINTQGIYR